MERKFTKIDNNNGCELIEVYNDHYMIIPFPAPEKKYSDNFVNLDIESWSENETIIKIPEKEYSKDIFYTVSSRVNKDKSVIEILDDVSDIYFKQKGKFLKFRGDLIEAMYLAFVGGKWSGEGETYDIEYNGENIEVKSYTPQKNTILISIEQIMQNSKKFAGMVRPDSGGISLKELVDQFKEDNPDFKSSLKRRYKNESDFWEKKYMVPKFHDVTNQVSESIKIESNVVSGKIEISIDVED